MGPYRHISFVVPALFALLGACGKDPAVGNAETLDGGATTSDSSANGEIPIETATPSNDAGDSSQDGGALVGDAASDALIVTCRGPVAFDDPAFENAVARALGVPSGAVRGEDTARLTSLILSGQ